MNYIDSEKVKIIIYSNSYLCNNPLRWKLYYYKFPQDDNLANNIELICLELAHNYKRVKFNFILIFIYLLTCLDQIINFMSEKKLAK